MRRLLCLTLALLALPARAQPPDPPAFAVPETVITATRVPTPLERVPAGVTVIERRTIEERGYQTLAEALVSVPGLHLVQLGGIGQQASVFLRGTASRHVLVLRDGVPLNDASEPNGAFNFGNDLLGPEVERIEVLRGPASALYGSAALGGVINIVTRRAPPGRTFAPFGEAALGTQRTLRLGAGATGAVGDFDYLFSLNSLSTRGFDATASRFLRSTGERDGFRGVGGTARLGWSPLERLRFEGAINWRENRFGLDNVPDDDPDYFGDDRRWTGSLRAEARPLEPWTTGLRLSRTEDRRRYRNEPDALSPASTDDLFRGRRTVLDWGNQVRLPDLGPLDSSLAAFGLTFEEESVEQDSGSPFFRTRVDATARQGAAHAAYQVRLWERLDLSAGFRNDVSDDYGPAATWRVGAVLAVPEASARLHAALGTAFKAPSLFQRFGRIGAFFQGNPDLRPERSESWEAGASLDLPLAGARDLATVSATYFDQRVRDLINFDAAFSSLDNLDRARIRGVEAALVLRPATWLEARAAYTVLDARDSRSGERLPRRPEQTLALDAAIRPATGVTIAPALLLYGRAREGAFASYRDDGRAFPFARDKKGGAVFNLVANWEATPSATLFAEGRNLGGSRYEPADGFQIPGRSLLVGTRLRL